MKVGLRERWFLAFTAVFAALAGFVFWGTWSPDIVAVMPDAWTSYPADHMARGLRAALANGKFTPFDLPNIFIDPYWWAELRYVVCAYLAALGVVYFCRGRGLSRLASYGAALLLAFCGYWFSLFSAGHFGWFQWMSSGVFAFGLADRAVTKGKLRHWLLLGAVVSWAGFNQQDLWLLFTLFTAAYFVWACVREHVFPWKGMLLAALTFTLIGLPNFIETLNVTVKGRQEQIAKGENITTQGGDDTAKRWEFVTNWSMPPEDTAEFVIPGVHGDTSCPFVLSIGTRLASGITPYTGRLGRPLNAPSGNYRQHSLYVGVVTCLLALLGVVFGVRRRTGDVLFFAAAALLFYLLSLGRFCEPLYRLVFALPAGDLIRCPVKWHHLTELTLAVLAAYGLNALCGLRLFAGMRARAILAGVVVLAAVDLARVNHRYCAPMDMTQARRHHLNASPAMLRERDFQNPQLAEMVRRGLVVSLAKMPGAGDVYLVNMLQPFGPAESRPIEPLKVALGILSVLTSLAVCVYGVKKA